MKKHNKNLEAGLFTTIATKLSTTDRAKLELIAERFGMSLYELLQSLLLALVRHFDPGSNLSDRHLAMIDAFFNVIRTASISHNPIKRGDNKFEKVEGAIFFVKAESDHPQLLAIGKDEQGELTESYNTDHMLAALLGAIEPGLCKWLEEERERNGLFSIVHTLHHLARLCHLQRRDTIGEEILGMFSDIRTPQGGRVNGDDIHYRRKRNEGDYTTHVVSRNSKRLHTDLGG